MYEDSFTHKALVIALHTFDDLRSVSYIVWLYTAALLTFGYALSRSIYLLYFHPLAKFPGPKLAAVSNSWYAWSWWSGRYPWAVEAILKEYGDVVRIAPNELVFVTPQAYTGAVDCCSAGHDLILVDIYSTQAHLQHPFIKTKFQDIGEEELGITAERDPARHKEVRRLLLPGFSAKSVAENEPVMHEHVDRFVEQMQTLGQTPKGLEMVTWSDWLAWDLAGDMGYNRQFNQVRDAKPSMLLTTMNKVGFLGTSIQVMLRFPWIKPLVWLLLPPSVLLVIPTLLDGNRKEMKARLDRRNDLDHPDYFDYVLQRGKTDRDPSEAWLLAQANVLIVAGFDPNTNLSSSFFYYLTKNPDKLARLVKEIRDEFPTYESIRFDALQKLKYLQAVLEESLRLHTNAGFGLPRISPGTTVDGHYVPAGCVVQTCFYATTHSETYWAKAREFHPERWLPSDHEYYDTTFKNDNKSAFTPFSQGPRGCPGAYVSYMQARLLLAKILWKFNMHGVNIHNVEWERDCRLYAIWQRPDIYIRFEEVER